MIKWVKQLTFITTTTLVLSGCSLFSSEEDVVKMAELPIIAQSYQPQIAWRSSIGSGVDKYYSQLQPAVGDKFVYVAARDGEVKALTIDGGVKEWSINLGSHNSNALNRSARLSGGIALAYETLYIGTENAQVFAIETKTGDIKWMSKVPGEVIAQPVYDSGKVLIHTSRGDLLALDSTTGEEVWKITNPQPKLTLRGSSTPSVAQGGVIFGRADGYVAAALLEGGRPLWQLPVARAYGATELERLVDVDMQPVIVNNTIYALAYNGNLIAIDLLKGQQLWARKYSGFKSISVAGNDLYLTDYRGYVFAVDRKDGEQRWVNKELSYRNVTGASVVNQFIVVGDAEGYLHWLDRDNGIFVAQQQLDSDGLYTEPVVTDTHFYLQTRSGKVIAIEKPILNVE